MSKSLYNNYQVVQANMEEGGNLRREKKELGAASGAPTKKVERLPEPPPRRVVEDIDASAEAFIKNFRQQLKIQRMQSMENYEQMLKRGL